MLTYPTKMETDIGGETYTLYKIYADDQHVLVTCDNQIVNYLISQGMMKKEAS